MFYEPAKRNHGHAHDPLLAIVAPRPIGWITSLSAKGAVNLAPYSYFNIFSVRPALVGFSSNGRKDTLTNVEETGEFVCNLAVQSLMQQVNLTSAPLARGRDEMEFAGLDPAPSLLVRPPRVAASPCALECRWTETIHLKNHHGIRGQNFLVLGEVLGVHVDEKFVVDGRVGITTMHSLARCGYMDYTWVESVVHVPRPDSSGVPVSIG